MNTSLLSALFALGLITSACSQPGTFSPRATSVAAPEGPGRRAVVVVRVPIPWYAPRSVVRGKFRDVLPEYEALAPLEAKYFTISEDDRYGGIYLWKTREDAERHFDAAWRAGVRARRGVDADVLVLDAPYAVEGPALPEGKPAGERAVDFPAWISLVRWELTGSTEVEAAARTAASLPWGGAALIRGFVVSGPREVGVVALWAAREAAEQACTAEERGRLGAALGARGSSAVRFEAPLLIDASLRQAGR
jgi:hypothetical protein